ncbi:Ig-like domain-containing protein [Fulvivirgaceae bacterium PWU4]|uniref:Ig-like domain-containing protein n=1 Tax=Chryseosolibacter histidini TaxID=2782349 RepID=A0AAP2DR60_9BACT|nr:Ig-like domain-containing protein [Chryseosolibacter histidini]MBT1700024.1 Ig-like domain-containing protein [Chryseosolibacter histidini]
MNLKKNLHWPIYFLFVLSCAKQTSPTGGPKDTIPPRLVNANPQNEAINFKGRSIELEFTEMVAANNPKEQLIITPSMGKDFEVKAKKNSIIVSFEKDFQDSTTYTFNFRDAVQDVTEKNPVRNLQLAISTGSYIDSLSIQGNVYDLLKGKEITEATVAIHPRNDTFNILKHPATYFTKTDKKGNFKIDHLRPDVYYIYAIDDKNRNLTADSRTEAYGFLKDSINLVEDTTRIEIGLIRLDARPLKLTSARPYNTYFNIRATKNLKTFSLKAIDTTLLLYSFGEDQANIKLYNTFADRDSLAVNLHAEDSIGNKLDTLLYAKISEREVTPEKFEIAFKSTSLLADKGSLKTVLTFTKPITEINFDSLYFQVDSATRIPFVKEDLVWEQMHNTLTITKTLDKALFAKPKTETTDPPQKPKKPEPTKKGNQNKTNQIYLGKGSFISVDGDTSKSTSQSTNPLRTEDLAMIIFQIKTTQKNFLVQLLDKNLNVLRQMVNKTKGQFEDLEAGDYMMRVVIDTNANNAWDPGNYLKRQEPERLFYYKDEKGSMTIPLKTNWEFELSPMLINY